VVAGVERLGRVGNLVGGVAAEALDEGVRPSTASASMEMPLLMSSVAWVWRSWWMSISTRDNS